MSERDELLKILCCDEGCKVPENCMADDMRYVDSLARGQKANAIIAAGWCKVPPGYVVVPREPSPGMCTSSAQSRDAGAKCAEIWREMIDAALEKGRA